MTGSEDKRSAFYVTEEELIAVIMKNLVDTNQ